MTTPVTDPASDPVQEPATGEIANPEGDEARERIRALGPTAPLTLNGEIYDRQHLGEDGHVSI